MTEFLFYPLVMIVGIFWLPFWFNLPMIATGRWPYLSEHKAKAIGHKIGYASFAFVIVLPFFWP